jgi:uncharacterized protein YdaU (DUF1376 family)
LTSEIKPDVWFPLVVGDYLKDTSRLTTEQHGAYLLLLMDYWVNGPPPDDDQALAAIVKLDARTWKKQRPMIARFFRIADGVWRQKRADEELARWAEKKAKYVARAAAGGRAKSAKSSATSTAQEGKNDPKSVLATCSASSPVKEEGPNEPSSLNHASAVALAAGSGAPVLRLVVPEPEPDDEEILFEETVRIDREEAKAAFAELLTHIGSKRIP